METVPCCRFWHEAQSEAPIRRQPRGDIGRRWTQDRCAGDAVDRPASYAAASRDRASDGPDAAVAMLASMLGRVAAPRSRIDELASAALSSSCIDALITGAPTTSCAAARRAGLPGCAHAPGGRRCRVDRNFQRFETVADRANPRNPMTSRS
jgi:hypothetical protein